MSSRLPPMHRIATEMFGLEVFKGFLDDVPAEAHGSFDVVALSDVFEHVTQPRQLLRSAAACLKPDGLLYVKVPNARWNLLKQQMAKRVRRAPRSLWDSYEHVVHYTDETLERILRAEGYEPLILTFSRPVQVPVWHEYVGQYFQYPSPWVLDWRRHLGRTAFHAAAVVEHAFRDRIGYCAQNLVAIARRQPNAPQESPRSTAALARPRAPDMIEQLGGEGGRDRVRTLPRRLSPAERARRAGPGPVKLFRAVGENRRETGK